MKQVFRFNNNIEEIKYVVSSRTGPNGYIIFETIINNHFYIGFGYIRDNKIFSISKTMIWDMKYPYRSCDAVYAIIIQNKYKQYLQENTIIKF